MTCKDCKNYQETNLYEYEIWDTSYLFPSVLYDCPYANDWCEADDEINTLCNNRFEPK